MAILDALTVSPLIGTNVLSLNYRSTDQRQAVRIVEVVIASFREYLRDSERHAHLETLRVLTRSERELREDLKTLEEEYLELRLKSPFVGRGRETASVRMNLLEHLGRTLSETKNRRIQLESSLQSLANLHSNGAVAETPSRSIGRSADDSSVSILFAAIEVVPVALVSARTHSQADDLQSLNEVVVLSALSMAQGSLAEDTALTRQELLTVRLREKELASRFGHKHPEIKAVREQIAILKSRLSETVRAAPAILDHELGSVKRDEERLGELYAYELEEAKIVDAYLVREQQAQSAIQRVQTIHDSILTQLREWQLSDDAVVGGRSGVKVAVLEAPTFTDSAAVWPTSTLVLGMFGMIGLIGGLGMVTVLEHMDDSNHTQ